MLKVEEVPEPTDVDFLHLGVPFVRQAMEQSTTLVGVVLMLTLLPARLRAARVAGCDRACPRPRARPRAADARALPVPACCPRPCAARARVLPAPATCPRPRAARARELPAPASCPRPRPAPTPSLLLPLRCSYPFGARAPSGAPTPSVSYSLVLLLLRCAYSFRCSYPFGVLFLSAPTPTVRVPLRCSNPSRALPVLVDVSLPLSGPSCLAVLCLCPCHVHPHLRICLSPCLECAGLCCAGHHWRRSLGACQPAQTS